MNIVLTSKRIDAPVFLYPPLRRILFLGSSAHWPAPKTRTLSGKSALLSTTYGAALAVVKPVLSA